MYLSIHPAITNVSGRIGRLKLDSLDFYGSVLPNWSGAFKKTNTMGIPGTKARIMMLYLWSLAFGLPQAKDEQGHSRPLNGSSVMLSAKECILAARD